MVASLTTCSRCRVQTEPDDQFCQDCGFHLIAAGKVRPSSPVELKAVLTCLNCGAQHEDATQFCESCGSRMSDMGVYTTTVRAIKLESSREQHSSAAVRLASSLRPSSPQPIRAGGAGDTKAVQANIHPAIEARNGPWRAELLGALGRAGNPSGSPGVASKAARAGLPGSLLGISLKDFRRLALLPRVPRWLLDLATSLVLLAFCASLIWWLANLESLRSFSAARGGFIQARAALGAGRLDESVKIMERLTLERDGALNVEERRVLNEALYRRAKAKAQKGDYKVAVADLLRISPDFADYAESKARLAEYSKLADAAVKAAGKDSRSSRSAAATSKSTSVSGGTASGQDSPPAATEVPTAAQDQSSQAADTKSSADAPDQAGYTDDEVVRYHKLLEGYFTTSRVGASKTFEITGSEDDAATASAQPDPHTLQEWLQQGKPDF